MKYLKLAYNSFLFIALWSYSFSFGQNHIEFEKLTGENVSTQSITYAIAQDSLGNIWVASEEGVLKHNSKYYKIYNTYNGLPESVSNRTTAIFIDSKQRVWIGLEKGICIYNNELDKFNLVGSKIEINPSLINAIAEDTTGNIWIGGFNGLWKYNDKTLNRPVSNHVIQTIYSYKDKLILGTPKGLFVYNPTNDSLNEIELDSESKNISYVGAVNNVILAGTKSGEIFKVNSNLKQTELIVLRKELSNPITDIIANDVNNIYIATDGDGLYHVNKTFSILNHFKEDADNKNSISSNGIYDIEIGNENILWIATYGGGVNFFDSNRLPFQKIQHQINNTNSIVSNFTRAIAEDKNGNLWFGTKQGISIWDINKNKWRHIGKLSKNETNIRDIVLALEPDNNYIWVGTYNSGLFKVNINNFESTHYNSIFPKKNILKKIYTIYKDSNSNIWFGGIEGDLAVIRPDKSIDTYPIYQIKSITESNSGNILAAGKNGIYKIDDTKTEFKLIENLNPNENTLAYSTINAVCQTKNGRLILATNGAGLIFYNIKDQSIKKLTVNNGMPSDIVQGIIIHNDTDFWASTTKGLAHITMQSNDDITINVFDKRDGLASTEYNYGSYEKLNDNLVAFGGVEGVTLFNPKNIKGQDYKPILVFDEFKLFNKAVKPGSKTLKKHINLSDEVELENKENSVEIKFTGILHGSSSKIKYSWKLEGFDKQWSTPSYTNFATYTNLNPGHYNFRVKASNKYGNFGEERSLKLNVLSPWWATNKAFILYALLILITILLIIYVTSVVINKKNADEQIHFFNNITHEIKTPLTILMSSLDNVTENVNSTNDESKKRIKTTIKRINSLFEQMLTFHKVTSQNFAAQDISEIHLKDHINHILYDFKPLTKERNLKIIITNNWSNEFFYSDIGVFDKIVLNLISNAIKYSFDDGKIMLNFSKGSKEQLKIEITDEGLGIPQNQQKYILKRYYRARNVINSQRPGTGLGLVMVKKLIEASGGSINFKSKENKGTTFTILLKNLEKKYKQNAISNNDTIQELTETHEDQFELDEFSDSKVLIVEDNDELREILVKTLGVYFQIFEADNGKKGLKIASQVFPDIILTDLIMPEMDGMEMSAKIKDDINLNHIPIFMLSVLQNSVQKLESIESGISEYIEKPVDIKFLLAKMANTLKWQKTLQKKYIHENDSDNASIYRNKNDQDFLKKLEVTIIENLENNTFSVHDLSESFGMSRTSLYMKLKNLVDLSPQDFIIHTKLRLAKKLLIKGEHSIKEVAYSSGFSNPKYFSTSFKKFYDTTPTAFLESLQKDTES